MRLQQPPEHRFSERSVLGKGPELDAGTSLHLLTFEPYRKYVLPVTIDLVLDGAASPTADALEHISLFHDLDTVSGCQNKCPPVIMQV